MRIPSAIAAAAAVALVSSTAMAGTLDDVKARGHLLCGITTGLAGFASPDDQGEWHGLDVDVCRAVAAGIFGDPKGGVKFITSTAKTRFPQLQSGEVDMLSRVTTWTFDRDVKLGFEFTNVNYYDGQGFMVRKDLGVKSGLDLDGASVCVVTGTTTELNLGDFFRSNNMSYTPVVYERPDEVRPAYEQGRCDVWTTDSSGLAAQKSTLANPDEHMILPTIISKEPLGPVVRHGDNQWGDVVRWSLNVMIIAEELGITSANVDDMKANTKNPEIKRMLGVEGEYGARLGLPNDWAFNIIKMVGNYGESFARNVGVDTPLGLPRGLNELWTKGGILYTPPFR
ncbi:MAG: amino acid ABC transporter substrate-binding protein [Alphaproteobacteria bacterium]|nr:amino acid ABC transporter substrate-binding protein [Alphaproteobacteria bacterium]